MDAAERITVAGIIGAAMLSAGVFLSGLLPTYATVCLFASGSVVLLAVVAYVLFLAPEDR